MGHFINIIIKHNNNKINVLFTARSLNYKSRKSLYRDLQVLCSHACTVYFESPLSNCSHLLSAVQKSDERTIHHELRSMGFFMGLIACPKKNIYLKSMPKKKNLRPKDYITCRMSSVGWG